MATTGHSLASYWDSDCASTDWQRVRPILSDYSLSQASESDKEKHQRNQRIVSENVQIIEKCSKINFWIGFVIFGVIVLIINLFARDTTVMIITFGIFGLLMAVSWFATGYFARRSYELEQRKYNDIFNRNYEQMVPDENAFDKALNATNEEFAENQRTLQRIQAERESAQTMANAFSRGNQGQSNQGFSVGDPNINTLLNLGSNWLQSNK